MANVSRPLIALLVGTVAFFALWLVAFRPSGPASGTASHGSVGRYQSTITSARQAVGRANAASAAHGGVIATTPTTTTPATTLAPTLTTPAPSSGRTVAPATPGTATTTIPGQLTGTSGAGAPATAQDRLALVQSALAQHKVLVVLFYNSLASDDRAVKQELEAVPTDGGRVVKLAAPIAELASYPVLTNQITVQESPTLVIVDPARQASMIAGFADGFEIAQRIDDALATPSPIG